MTAGPVRVSPSWLAVREAADAAARAPELVDQLRRRLAPGSRAVIHDLGCGTGSMARWLAPQLDGPQDWVMHDRDADLLAHACRQPPPVAADGSTVTLQTRPGDLTRLDEEDLAGAALITASALLDMTTADELERLVAAMASAGCPVLVTISVIGRVDLAPADPLDADIVRAFNDHQRRTTGGRKLLGPDAVGAAVGAFTRRGADVLVRPSPWCLGAGQVTLTEQWFTGWVGAAREQRPEMSAAVAAYARRRLAEAAAGRLNVTVHHHDLLVRPR